MGHVERGTPELCVEVLSPSDSQEKLSFQEKLDRYRALGTRELVREIPGRPGSYNAIAYLRPWLQLEELTTSMRLVARIPQPA